MKHWLIYPGALVAVVVAYYGGQATSIAHAIPQVITGTVAAVTPPPERIEVTRLAMVKSLEGKVEITTASMWLDKYVPAGRCSGNVLQQWAYRDCITLLVAAKINAGFNWQTFSVDQIKTDAKTVTIDLGTPSILDVVIDHERTKLLNQDDGAFVFTPDQTLQLRAIAKVSTEFRRDACRNGILRVAALEAEKRVGDNLRLLLHAAGDTRVVKIVYSVPAYC